VVGALGMFAGHNVTGKTISYSGGTNSSTEEFVPIVASAKIKFSDQFGYEMVKGYGELVYNVGPSTGNKGGIIGMKFGHSSLFEKGNWQIDMNYRYLGQDAWFDFLPDADSYGGLTDVQGLEVSFGYGLSKNTALALDIISMDRIKGAKDKQLTIQADFNVKI
jgi:hypothetical protein